jgi:hypothetical protein
MLAYTLDLRNAEILLSARGKALGADYISTNPGFWDKPRTVMTGARIEGYLTIEDATGPILARREFRVESEPSARIHGSGKNLDPMRSAYRNYLLVELVDAFSRMAENRIRFLLETYNTSPELSRAARIALLQPDMADEIEDPLQLGYVMELLKRSDNPTTRFLAACMLSFADDDAAFEALLEAQEDQEKVPHRQAPFGGSFPVSQAARLALTRIQQRRQQETATAERPPESPAAKGPPWKFVRDNFYGVLDLRP